MNVNSGYRNKWGLVSFLTLLSRIVGYFRDVIVAYLFGAGIQTDAFYVAFRIPNILRRLFAEGSLTVAFIPIFTEYLELKDEKEAKKALYSIFSVLLLILILLTVLGVIFAPYVIKLYAYGFDEITFSTAVKLNRIMFPYILFISLTALAMGVLNSVKHFFAPAFSPVLFNISMIICALLLYSHFDLPIISLAIGVIIGGICQLSLNLYFLKKKGFIFKFTKVFKHEAVRRVGMLMAPQLFGIAVYNINILVNTQFASFMPTGTVSYLYFSERLIEFPLGIIAVSIATVMLPALSSDATIKNFENFKDKYYESLRLMLYIMIPAMVGLIVLRVPICNILYQHGEFDYIAVIKTSQALFGYGIGLWAIGGIRITVPAFYALQDTKTPVFIAFIAFIVNTISAYVLGFVFELNHLGLAIASSISSTLNFLLLLYFLDNRLSNLINHELLSYILKITAVSVFMGIIVMKIASLHAWTQSELSLYKVVIILSSILIGAVFFFIASRLLSIKELDSLVAILKRRKY
ncbi:MAG: murein biosynthesis integral membrane protein MurJ [Candidatus Dadabacteria bacterium]|nr:murein biosynthesis integral membrane protein MurJ [Candidatus Dadabacteria bacterium]NIQ15322.1 murein biosynthesis integral membrane protein MurJ [Candidatus Dadabacteria bacterium]